MAGSLTRISAWEKGHGWKPTSPDLATLKYGQTIYAREEIFLCELCGQYAGYIHQPKNPRGGYKASYFHHPQGSKSCPEKTTSSDPYLKVNPLGFSLPVKVKVENGQLEIFIGFMPVGEMVLSKAESEKANCVIRADNKIVKTYSISQSRFLANELTYLSIGDHIAERYKIDSNGSVDKNIWPPSVEGVLARGSLFDNIGGKRLPRNANVEVGKEYLLITKRNIYGNIHRDIEIKRSISANGYFLYTVKATALSFYAANFFLDFGARLTDAPAELTQIYPFVLRASHVILHEAVKIWFHKTNGFADTYPSGDSKGQHQSIFEVRGETQKILSLSRFEGRTSVLRFMVLRRDSRGFRDATQKQQSSAVKVVDSLGSEFANGEYDKLPKERELIVTSEFDGFVDVVAGTNNIVVQRLDLKNGVKTTVKVSNNHKYRIFQGLDCVHEIAFIKKKKTNVLDDEHLLRRLKSFTGKKTAIHHSFGAVGEKLGDMPLSRLWVMRQIRLGQIDARAKDYLLKIQEGAGCYGLR